MAALHAETDEQRLGCVRAWGAAERKSTNAHVRKSVFPHENM
jgi:hypothetical protein